MLVYQYPCDMQRYDGNQIFSPGIVDNGSKEWQAGCPLEKEDVDILRDMVSGLGRSDSRSQSRIFTPAALRLEANLKKAAEREEKLGRMYKALGTAAGIVIVILII